MSRDASGRFVSAGGGTPRKPVAKSGDGNSVSDRTTSGYLALERIVAAGAPSEITVGVHGDSGAAENGVTLTDLANWHQFGEGVPARPWLTDWFDAKRDRILEGLRLEIEDAFRSGGDLNRAFGRLAVAAQADIQRFISDEAAFQPNADSTLRRKAPQTRPLIHRGIFRAGILAKVDGRAV